MLWHEIWCVLQAFAPWLLLGALVAGLPARIFAPGFMGRFFYAVAEAWWLESQWAFPYLSVPVA